MNADFFAFCTSLHPLGLKAIGSLSEVRHLPAHETIYRPGDVADTLFIINRGVVEAFQGDTTDAGAGTYLTRGDMFGDLEVLAGLPRQQLVRACEPISLQCFRRDDFPELLQRVPRFFQFLSEQLAGRLLQARDLAGTRTSSLELSGSLTNFDLVTIYQTIVNSSQTGELSICDEKGELSAAFSFDKGIPAGGQFQHLTGEEAFLQLFLTDDLHGTFSFSSNKDSVTEAIKGAAIDRHPADLLITALQSRDEFHELKKTFGDCSARLVRQRATLSMSETDPAVRQLAERIWQLTVARQPAVSDLYPLFSVSELKLHVAVQELVDSGNLALSEAEIPQEAA